MAEDSPNQPKNRAFLAQFLDEGIYLVPGEEISVMEEGQEQPSEEAPEVAENQIEQVAEASPASEDLTVEEPAAPQPEAPSQETSSGEASNQETTDDSIPSEETANNETPQLASEGPSVKNDPAPEQDQEESPAVTETPNNSEEETPGSEEPTVEQATDQETETPPQATSSDQKTAEETLTTEAPIPPFEGQNQKGILILVKHQSDKNLLPKEQLILGRILKAVNLSMDDVAVVNLEKTGASIEQITKALATEQILAFGLDATDLPMPAQPMKPEEWNGLPLLAAPSLEEIAMNKQNKKQLWHNLKTMFDI